MIQVFSQSLGDFSTNAYLYVSGDTAIAIDAPPGAADFFDGIVKKNNLKWRYLLLTHSHFDHISEALEIQKKGIIVGIHPLDQNNCLRPGSDGLPLMMSVGAFVPDFFLKEGLMSLDGIDMTVYHTPGHTPGGICLTIGDVMFSGDTFFQGAIGNLSFPTCNYKLMKTSLELIISQPIDYTVYPGHGPKTTLFREKAYLKHMIHQIGQVCH
jgi:hydroxyacylglutathione hydrolase